jgi:hypothetical protein
VTFAALALAPAMKAAFPARVAIRLVQLRARRRDEELRAAARQIQRLRRERDHARWQAAEAVAALDDIRTALLALRSQGVPVAEIVPLHPGERARPAGRPRVSRARARTIKRVA